MEKEILCVLHSSMACSCRGYDGKCNLSARSLFAACVYQLESRVPAQKNKFLCIENLLMKDSGETAATKGLVYTIEEVEGLWGFTNDSKELHYLDSNFMSKHFKEVE